MKELKKDLLKNIHYFTCKSGAYYLIKNHLYTVYELCHAPHEIDQAIDELIKEQAIIKTSKKALYDGRYITKTMLKVNYELITPEDIVSL